MYSAFNLSFTSQALKFRQDKKFNETLLEQKTYLSSSHLHERGNLDVHNLTGILICYVQSNPILSQVYKNNKK
jgi:hypothetical protein